MTISLTPKERLFATLDRQPVDRIPIVQPLQTGTVELMKSCDAYWPQAHCDPELMAALAYEAYRVGGFESVRVPFDINVEAEAMGAELDYEKGPSKGLDIQPSVGKTAMAGRDDFSRVKNPDPHKDGRMPVVLKAVEILRKRMPDTIPLIAAVVGPFMVAGQVRGVEHVMGDLIRYPDSVQRVVERAYEACLSFARALVEAGADCIAIIDASSGPELISPRHYEQFSKKYAQSLARNISVRSVLHICGKTDLILTKMAEVTSAISVSAQVDIAEARKKVDPGTAVCGNISSEVLLFGNIADVEENVKICIEKGTDILCSECGIPPRTPTANLNAMVEAGKKFATCHK